MKKIALIAAAAAITGISTPASADQSSGYKQQAQGEAQIPVCTHRLGTLAIVPPDNQGGQAYNLGSPEAVIKVFVQRSGCFGLVNRGSAMRSRSRSAACRCFST